MLQLPAHLYNHEYGECHDVELSCHRNREVINNDSGANRICHKLSKGHFTER